MIDSEIVALLHALKGARAAFDQEVLDGLEDAARDHLWGTTDIRCHRGIHFAAGSNPAIDIMIDAGVLVIASTDAKLRTSARAALEENFDRRLPRWRENVEVLELPHPLPLPARPPTKTDESCASEAGDGQVGAQTGGLVDNGLGNGSEENFASVDDVETVARQEVVEDSVVDDSGAAELNATAEETTTENTTAATAVITALLNRRYGDAAKMERRAIEEASRDQDELIIGPDFISQVLKALQAMGTPIAHGVRLDDGVTAMIVDGLLDVRAGRLDHAYASALDIRDRLPAQICNYLRLSKRFSVDWRAALSPYELQVGAGQPRIDVNSVLLDLEAARTTIADLGEAETLRRGIATAPEQFFRPPVFPALVQLRRSAIDWTRSWQRRASCPMDCVSAFGIACKKSRPRNVNPRPAASRKLTS
jgi:hypothetical protein